MIYMETLILLFLLATANSSPEMKQSLSSALAFYRENRELFSMLANGAQNPSAEQKAPAEEARTQQNSRPPAGEAGSQINILEEYLKTHAL